jgi:hypothetical protein
MNKKKRNSVLKESPKFSSNFYESDGILRHFLEKNLSSEAHAEIKNPLGAIGKKAAQEMDKLSLLAD